MSDFDKSGYTSAHFSSGDKIEKGSPIYKAINDDEWSIVLKFNKSDVKKYKKTSNITIKFLKDNLTTTANLKIVKGADENQYGVVTLAKYVVCLLYTSQRLLLRENPVRHRKINAEMTIRCLLPMPHMMIRK